MRKTTSRESGFALALTLVLMALIVIVVVAFLVSTRIERSTSSVNASRMSAKMTANSGLNAAVHLLRENTRYGNYITAMPAPSPSPAPHYTEIYRPSDPSDPTHAAKANDYLQLGNAAGEILISRAAPSATTSPLPQLDPRPTPEAITTSSGPFALSTPNPGLSSNNSYDFNQIIRIGSSDSGRLVDPDSQPAFGQWISIRNNAGEAVGRYAFFVEDESMKLNLNVTGNNLAAPSPTASPNLRINDLLAIPGATPSSQIQELDPTALLLAANRRSANTALLALGTPGQRLPTKLTTSLLSNWTTIENYAHLLTTISKDDNATARGWQRLDINSLVAGAVGNAAKVAVATRLANWMRDAWTGPTTLTSLQPYQLFNDDRLRLQIAANIVDYIDQDNVPTDMGDVVPAGFTDAVPVIGIEKIPYLLAVEVLYEASNSTCPSPPVPGTYSANLRFKLQFRFLNLFDSSLDPADTIGRIEVKGVPVITKNGPLTPPFDFEATNFVVPLANLKPVKGTGACSAAGTCIVPAGTDGASDSGAKTVQTDWLQTQQVNYTVSSTDQNPKLQAGKLTVKVYGKGGERLDDTAIVLNATSTGYVGPNSSKDFLTDASPSTGPLEIASINLVNGVSPNSFETGDPRYRGQLINDRWRNLGRTDATLPTNTNRVAQFIDKAELNPRSYGVDWYDESGNRPLAYIRNSAMLNIGELGLIATSEYPWRSLYLQHPERPPNTSQAGPKDDIPLRRANSQDYVLVDLLRAGGSMSRSGALNINTQQHFTQIGATFATLPLQALFMGLPVGASGATLLTRAAPAAPSPSPADRLSTSVNLLVNAATVAPTGSAFVGTSPVAYRIASVSNKRYSLAGETIVPDYSPARPYFQIGELAPTLSRLLSASEASDTGASTSRSKVVYSAIRSDPQQSTGSVHDNYRKDDIAEQAFREVSNSVTTHGNVFRILYVGQSLKNGVVQAEYLGEAFVERQSQFAPEGSNPDAVKTSDSDYRIIANRVVTE